MKAKGQEGFATIYVLVLCVALFMLASLAMKILYSLHEQNKKDKSELVNRAAHLEQNTRK